MYEFWDREKELAQLGGFIGKGGFGYVTGRRRVGKTAILVKACEKWKGLYTQAVEGTPQQQLQHIADEFKEQITIFRSVTPKTWSEFFALLSREELPPVIVLDEFPYLVLGDAMLPSVLQKWIDHELPKKKVSFIVSGSSQSMLYSQFLKQSSPLYGRAVFHLHLEPLPYEWFCKALKYDPKDPESFERYSLVGGVPHYWKLMPEGNLPEQIEHLYFQPSAILAEEPKHLLQDEGVVGAIPKAILDLVGSGVTKPSELASRIGVVQNNLSRPLSLLLELGLICRELPFGESARTTKKVFYTLQDPVMAFYYGVYLQFKGRWANLSTKEKKDIINLHVSRQWESFCRNLYPGASRYWEGDVEIDIVAPQKNKSYIVGECKWRTLSKNEEENLIDDLRKRFLRTRLSIKLAKVEYRIFSKRNLEEL